MALRKSRQHMNRHSLFQLNTRGLACNRDGFAHNALCLQCVQVLGHCVVLCIDTQGHGRSHLRRFQQDFPLIWVIVLQALHPPSRMIPLGRDIAIGGLEQSIAFAQKTS